MRTALLQSAAVLIVSASRLLSFEPANERKILYDFLGKIYRGQEDLSKEEGLYKKALTGFPEMEGEYLYKLADVYERGGQFEKALEVLEEIKKKFPAEGLLVRARLTSAWIYCHKLGDYKRAARIYKKLAKKDTGIWTQSAALLSLAETYEFRHKYKKALRIYSKTAKKFPGTQGAYDADLRADAIQNGGEDANAVLRLFTRNYRLWRAKEFEEAIAVCREIVSEYPDSYLASSAQYYTGLMLHFDLQDYEGAIAEYEQTLANYPESARAPFALYRIGECYREQGKMIMAREINMRLLKEYPGSLPSRWAMRPAAVSDRF